MMWGLLCFVGLVLIYGVVKLAVAHGIEQSKNTIKEAVLESLEEYGAKKQ